MVRKSRLRVKLSPYLNAVFTSAILGIAGCTTISYPYVEPPAPVAPPPMSNLAFGYVDSTVPSTLSQFEISSTGLWKSLTPAQIPTGSRPVSLAVDPAGRFLYTANRDDGTISQYVIDPVTGQATPNQPATVSGGSRPTWLAVDPSSRFLYVAAFGSKSVLMFQIDQTNGTLTPTSPSSVLFTGASGSSYPLGLAVDPLGRYLFATDGNLVDTYIINPTTGY